MKKKNSFLIMIKSLFLGTKHLDEMDILKEDELQSPFRTIVKNFLANKVAMTGAIIFSLIFLASMILPIFYPLMSTFQDSTQQNVSPSYNMLSIPSALDGNVRDISVGSTFSIGVDNDGNVYQWGVLSTKLQDIPEDMGDVVAVSAGLDHALALNSEGEVFTWGNNRLNLTPIPDEVLECDNIAQVIAGNQLSFAITEDGILYQWGNTSIISVRIPDEIQGKVATVVSNTSIAIALTTDGYVYPLTIQDTSFGNIPEEVQGDVVNIALTSKSVAVITSSGTIYTWGSTDEKINTIPTALQGNALDIDAGRNHFTAVSQDGYIYSWGENYYGESDAPTKVSNAVSVTSGYYQNYVITDDGSVVKWGLSGYLMGTDALGRDVLNRLISGGRLTILIGAIAVIIQSIIGIIVGGIAGYYGGFIDNFLMRFAEVVGSIPFIPLAMILSAVIGSSISEDARIIMIMCILGVLSWPGLARLIRGQVLAEREKEFVTAAKAMGLKERVIIFKHIMPNVITVIIVSVTLSFASSMLTETSLSFLGFGVLEPKATWGNMLTGSQSSTVIKDFWWRWVFPALALGLSTISINLIGDGLRNAIDPKSNER